jgi:hypothetical protein
MVREFVGRMADRCGGVAKLLYRCGVVAVQDGIPRLLDQVREQILA